MAITAIAGIATAGSVVQQRKARKEQKRANAVERRQAEVRNIRERKKALASRIRASAEAEAAGETAGIGGGAGVVKAEQASLGSQFGSNVGFAQEIQQLEQERVGFLQSAADASGRAGLFQTVGGVAQSFGAAKQRAAANKTAELQSRG